MVEKVAFTMVPVTDTARARAFYEGVLGLTVGSHSGDGVWTEYDLPRGGCIALFNLPGRGNPSATHGATVALEVDDLDVTLVQLEARGVRIRERMIHSPVCRMSVILDSEGNGILLHQLHRRRE